MDLNDNKQHTFTEGVYPHLSKLTFSELLFSLKSTRVREEGPLKLPLQAPALWGHGPGQGLRVNLYLSASCTYLSLPLSFSFFMSTIPPVFI